MSRASMGVRLRRAQIAQGWQRDRILCHPGAVLHVPLCSLCSSVTQSSLVSRWRKKMAQCAHSILSSFSSSPPKPYSEFRRLRTSRASKCELRGRAWKPEGLTDQTFDRCQRRKRWPDARTACQIAEIGHPATEGQAGHACCASIFSPGTWKAEGRRASARDSATVAVGGGAGTVGAHATHARGR